MGAENMNENKNVVCLYHANCRDDAAAAWAVRRRFPEAKCLPVKYGEPPPLELVQSCCVYVVDFSYPNEDLLALADVAAGTLTVIDHHESRRADLLRLAGEAEDATAFDVEHPGIRIVYDVDRSGAGLTWDTLFPGEARPWFIDYIEDRDLWRWALPFSNAVNAYLSTLRDGPEAFDVLRSSYPVPYHVVNGGTAGLRYRDRLVERMVATARRGRLPNLPGSTEVQLRCPACGAGPVPKQFTRNFCCPECFFEGPVTTVFDLKVPTVNASVLQSEVCHVLCQGEPFAAAYWDEADDVRRWSLRSAKDGIDVSEIAKLYGGGGHKHAAGFREVLR